MSKKQWGNACWYLFHTLAEKLKPEHSSEAPIITTLITNICFNLPCPVCSTHARNNLSKMPRNYIKTKDDLKHFLWKFHNIVNKQLHKPQQTHEACNRFVYARTGPIIEYFKFYMSKHTGQLRMAITNHNKNMHVNNLLNYLYRNAHKFNP